MRENSVSSRWARFSSARKSTARAAPFRLWARRNTSSSSVPALTIGRPTPPMFADPLDVFVVLDVKRGEQTLAEVPHVRYLATFVLS